MKELFSEDQLYEKCLEEKDKELARTLWKNIWEKDKLETLKEILGTSPEAEAVSMRLKTIRHMENLKQMGYPAEINERTIRYNGTLEKEGSAMWGTSRGFPTCRERDVGHMDAQIRDKARSSPAVGLLRALWTHFASAPFCAPVANFRGG